MMKTAIAVYGTLLSGERNARLCGSIPRRPCRITGTIFDTGYGYPAYHPHGDTRVRAELIEADETMLSRLDRLEGYPSLYRREKVTAVCQDGTAVECQVYVMNHLPRGARIILSGDWRQYRKENQ